ncbi:MAG: hypothetical protein ACE5J7_04970 [Candidatus Aenigmatarchaeota archaeon]
MSVNPGDSFTVTANISDVSNTSIKSTNITCIGSGGVEGTDSWDSFTVQNSSTTWTVMNLTAVEVSGTINLNTSSINGTWTCTVYGYNITDDSASASNNSLNVATRVGFILSQSTCTYDSGNPASANNNWTCDGSSYTRITHDGNLDYNLTINGTDLTGQADASWIIVVGNVTYSNVTAGDPAPSPPGTALSNTIADLISFWARGTYPTKSASDLYSWINYPSPLKVQTYQGAITLLAVASG